MADVIHNHREMQTEWFVPTKKIVIGKISDTQRFVAHADHARTTPSIISEISWNDPNIPSEITYGKVANIRQEELSTEVIDRCFKVLEAGGDQLTLSKITG